MRYALYFDGMLHEAFDDIDEALESFRIASRLLRPVSRFVLCTWNRDAGEPPKIMELVNPEDAP